MQNNSADYNFSEHKFPDIKLERCSIMQYNPSQAEKISVNKGIHFSIITDGKGYVTYNDKRQTLTKGKGLALTSSMNVEIKADGIEPFTIIHIKLVGEASKNIYSLIENKENGPFMNFSEHEKIIDSAQELILDCSNNLVSDYLILLHLMEFLSGIEELYTTKKIPTKNVYMTQAVDYIKKNYNKNISVESISDMLGIERSYLSRLFKNYKNKSTQNYIIDYRIRQAKRMFEQEDMNVSQVSAAVGYTNIYCFSRIFKSRVGIPPKEYMEKCKKMGI